GGALAAVGELDPLELVRIDVRRAVGDAEMQRAADRRHEEAVAVPHEGAEGSLAARRAAAAEAQLLDPLDRDPFRPRAGDERQVLVLDEAAHVIAVDERDAREPPLPAPERNARDRGPRELEAAVSRPHPEAGLLDAPPQRVAGAQLQRVDVGTAPHLLR